MLHLLSRVVLLFPGLDPRVELFPFLYRDTSVLEARNLTKEEKEKKGKENRSPSVLQFN